jgi:hypothetical protein
MLSKAIDSKQARGQRRLDYKRVGPGEKARQSDPVADSTKILSGRIIPEYFFPVS